MKMLVEKNLDFSADLLLRGTSQICDIGMLWSVEKNRDFSAREQITGQVDFLSISATSTETSAATLKLALRSQQIRHDFPRFWPKKVRLVWTLETNDSTMGGNKVLLTQSNRGFTVSGARRIQQNRAFVRENAIPELDFLAENLRFLYKMWSNATAPKKRTQRLPFWSPSGGGTSSVAKIQRNLRRLWSFRQASNAIPPWDTAEFTLASPNGRIAFRSPQISHFWRQPEGWPGRRKPTCPAIWLPYDLKIFFCFGKKLNFPEADRT